jgi:hypothetical protein
MNGNHGEEACMSSHSFFSGIEKLETQELNIYIYL